MVCMFFKKIMSEHQIMLEKYSHLSYNSNNGTIFGFRFVEVLELDHRPAFRLVLVLIVPTNVIPNPQES